MANIIGGVFRLTAEAIRGLARNLFPGFYERDISANKALGELRELGLGYRRQDFLSDFSAGKSIYEQAVRVRFVNLDKTPTEGILEPHYYGTPDKYSFVFRVEGVDTATQQEAEQYFFYHRNSLNTRRQMEVDAQDWFDSQAEKYAFEVTAISIVEGYINPVWA